MRKEIRASFNLKIDNFAKENNFQFKKSTLYLSFGKPVVNAIYFTTSSERDGSGCFHPQFYVWNNHFSQIKSILNNNYLDIYLKSPTVIVSANVYAICRRNHRLDLNWMSYFDESRYVNLGENVYDEVSLNQYIIYFQTFMDELGFKFFDSFKEYKAFDDWFNYPFYFNDHKFKIGEVENNCFWGVIGAKLSKNKEYEDIYKFWTSFDLPIFDDCDIRKELKMLKAYLDENY